MDMYQSCLETEDKGMPIMSPILNYYRFDPQLTTVHNNCDDKSNVSEIRMCCQIYLSFLFHL